MFSIPVSECGHTPGSRIINDEYSAGVRLLDAFVNSGRDKEAVKIRATKSAGSRLHTGKFNSI
jgi:hypothetical protein